MVNIKQIEQQIEQIDKIKENLDGFRVDCDKALLKLDEYKKNKGGDVIDLESHVKEAKKHIEATILLSYMVIFCCNYSMTFKKLNEKLEGLENFKNDPQQFLKSLQEACGAAIKDLDSYLGKFNTQTESMSNVFYAQNKENFIKEVEVKKKELDNILSSVKSKLDNHDTITGINEDEVSSMLNGIRKTISQASNNLDKKTDKKIGTIEENASNMVTHHADLLKRVNRATAPGVVDIIKEYLSAAINWLSKIFTAIKELIIGKPGTPSEKVDVELNVLSESVSKLKI